MAVLSLRWLFFPRGLLRGPDQVSWCGVCSSLMTAGRPAV